MRRTMSMVAYCSVIAISSQSLAAEFPAWPLSQVCAEESDPAACQEFEAVARHQVSGPWNTLPSEIRKTCLDEVSGFVESSYRILRMCLETKLFERHNAAQRARRPSNKPAG